MMQISLAFLGVAVLFSCAAEKSPASGNLQRAKGLYYSLKMHAQEHEGMFPRDLYQLAPESISGARLISLAYVDPVSERKYDWLYFAPQQYTVDPAWILLASPTAETAKDRPQWQRIIVQADGIATFASEEEFLRRINLQHSQPVSEPKTASLTL